MKNLKFSGEQASVTLAAAVEAGEFVIQGGLVGIAFKDGAIGDTIEVALKGVFFQPKTTGVAITQGDALYLASSGTVGVDPDGTDYVGIAHADAASGDATVDVMVGATSLFPQNTLTALAAPYTVSTAATNSATDINIALTANNGNLNLVAAKVNAVIDALEAAGILKA